jgi:stress-induced morphogen
MATETRPRLWEARKTDETRAIERMFREHYPDTEAYRYNSASIRVRIIDEAFAGKSDIEREQMVDPILDKLSEATQSHIMLLLTLTESETKDFGKDYLTNLEFENPSVSKL